MRCIRFTIHGKPEPAGSKRAFVIKGKKGSGKKPRAIIVDANPHAKDWKAAVRDVARSTYDGPLYTGPLELGVDFFFVRPKGHYGTGRNAERLRADAPTHHVQKPDTTKLLRGLEDALTSVIWRDDVQVCQQQVRKFWADLGAPAGAEVTITALNKEGLPP